MDNFSDPGSPDFRPLLRLAAIGLGIYAINALFNNDNDTVNYILWHRKRIVYHGICYADRIDARLNEHELNGLIFDEYDHDHAKPRLAALKLERKRIKRDQPKYNIHHNC